MKAHKAILLTVAGIAFFCALVLALVTFSSFFSGSPLNGALPLLSFPAVIVLAMLINYLNRCDWEATRTATEFLCPRCGYNMRGLSEAICPECGAAFTLDQLKVK